MNNSKFFIFDDVKSQNGSNLTKMEKWSSKFFISCKVHGRDKNEGKILLFFALDLKQKLAAETFALHSDPKIICFAVHFHK